MVQTILKRTWDVLENKLLDKEFNGILSAIDYTTNELLTQEKLLESQALSAWAAIQANKEEIAYSILDYLVDSVDKEYGGVIEARERYGLTNELGNVKTTYRMFLAAYIFLLARKLPNGEKYVNYGLDIIQIVEEYALNKEKQDYYHKMSRNWDTVLDDSRDPRSLIFSVLALVEKYQYTSQNEDLNNMIIKAELLLQLIDGTGRIIDHRNVDGSVATGAKVNLEVSSLSIISLIELYRVTEEEKFLKAAYQVLNFINSHLWDHKFGGYWTHCDLDGKITIHKEFITLLTSSIPIKTSKSNAWALIANCLVSQYNGDKNIEEALSKGITYLSSLFDRVNGGFYIGEGYFWTPPGSPVGPFQRLMLPSRETPGTFHFGSSSFLRLYNKHADSQAVSLLAFELVRQALGGFNLEVAATKPKEDFALNEFKLETHKLSEQKKTDLAEFIDVEKHISWINAAHTKGLGYGWTPNISPIGTKPDRTPSVFGTHHSIANLKVLGEPIEDKENIANWIRLCQSPNGAFGEYPGGPADVLNTYLAINVLDILGEENFGDKEACINYLNSCQNPDGGYGVVPGFKSDLFHTNLAAVAIHTLGSEPKYKDELIEYLLSAENADGGYGEYPGSPSDTYSCYRVIGTLALYNKSIPNPQATIEFLKKCQGVNGGFGHDWNSRQSMVATYHAVASLFLLESEPERVQDCIEWLTGCQTPDGGISNIPGVTTGTIDEGFAAVQSLCILQRGLSPYFAILVS